MSGDRDAGRVARYGRGFDLPDARVLAELEELLRRAGREQVHAPGDHAGPARLMARAEPRSVVAVEVLVEQDQVPPVGVLLELLGAAVDRAASRGIAQEDARQAALD